MPECKPGSSLTSAAGRRGDNLHRYEATLTFMRPYIKAGAAADADAKPAHACNGDVCGALPPALALYNHTVGHQCAQAVLCPEGWRQDVSHVLLIPALAKSA